jgi:acetyl-CoA C-acetyltransferase
MKQDHPSDIVISGIGQIPAGEHWDHSLRQLGTTALKLALKDAGDPKPQALYVANMLSMNLSNQAHLATLIADSADLTGIEALTIEAGAASGGAAIRQAYLAVKSGYVDTALVLGVEKFSDKVGAELEEALATNLDGDFESIQGLTPSAQAALIMKRYMVENDVPADGFAGFALNAHHNGAGNKFAMFQKAISKETYHRAEMVSDPLNMFDIAPPADGAAAVVITRRELVDAALDRPLVRVSGSALSTDTLSLHDRVDPLEFKSAAHSAIKALAMASIPNSEIDFFELHDQYSVFAALALESAGFAPKGQGWKLAQDGSIGLSGVIPVGTFGGLKARGFTGGASGVYQAVEAVLQLRGLAGKCQVVDARHGMIQSMGGPASTAVTHILSK